MKGEHVIQPVDTLRKIELDKEVWAFVDENGVTHALEAADTISESKIEDILLDVTAENVVAQDKQEIELSFHDLNLEQPNLRSVNIMGQDLAFQILPTEETMTIVPVNFETDSIEGQIFTELLDTVSLPKVLR